MTAHPVRLVTDQERRARVGVRHALAASARVTSPEEVAHSVVCLHATDPPSVHLSVWARTTGVSADDVERALYETRTLVRQQAMRETLFVFPRDLLPAVWGSAAAHRAATARKRNVKDLERWGPVAEGEGEAWLDRASRALVDHLGDGVERSAKQLREEVEEASGFLHVSPDKAWGSKTAIAPKLLSQLHLEGVLARGTNAGAWHQSRPLWTTTQAWWGGEAPAPLDARTGWAELVDRWLGRYGPGTVEDLTWWLGATKTVVRAALADVGARPVQLEDGSTGWLRDDDLDVVEDPEPWVALLPLLDPTIMGWKQRDFLIDPQHAPELYDSVGNAGTTVLVDGRVVGVWVQDADGVVELRLLEEVAPEAREALDAEARRLTEWLDGQRVFTVYPSPAMRRDPG